MTPDNDDLAADMLRGADAIARFLGFPRRSIYHMAARNSLPHFKLGDTICARRSTLTRWIEQQESAAA